MLFVHASCLHTVYISHEHFLERAPLSQRALHNVLPPQHSPIFASFLISRFLDLISRYGLPFSRFPVRPAGFGSALQSIHSLPLPAAPFLLLLLGVVFFASLIFHPPFFPAAASHQSCSYFSIALLLKSATDELQFFLPGGRGLPLPPYSFSLYLSSPHSAWFSVCLINISTHLSNYFGFGADSLHHFLLNPNAPPQAQLALLPLQLPH